MAIWSISAFYRRCWSRCKGIKAELASKAVVVPVPPFEIGNVPAIELRFNPLTVVFKAEIWLDKVESTELTVVANEFNSF